MKKCIIHIGMHKTGSSSIQDTLSSAKLDKRFIYANLGMANHSGKIFTLFSENPENYHSNKKKGLSKQDIEKEKIIIKKRLVDTFLTNPNATIIISGEDIEFLSKKALNAFKVFLEDFVETIQIVAYIRSPISLIESGYQQRVKGNSDLDLNKFKINYRSRFEKFEELFGQNNISYWEFLPSKFENKNVVLDFCARLDIPIDHSEVIRSNDSISQEALSLLLCYRKFGPGYGIGPKVSRENQLLIMELNKIGSTKFKLSYNFAKMFLEKMKSDLEWMGERVDKDFLYSFNSTNHDGIETIEELLNPKDEIIDQLILLIGKDNTPIKSNRDTKQEYVAKLVHTLREKIVGRLK